MTFDHRKTQELVNRAQSGNGAAFEELFNRRRARLRSLLVVLQVAMSLLLIHFAGLLLSTTQNLQAIDLGFDTSRLLVFNLDLRPQGYPEAKVKQMQLDLLERLKTIPGVQSVSLANSLPVRGMFSGSRDILPEGREQALSGQRIQVDYNEVAAHYFETLGVPLIMGRSIAEADTATSPPMAVISESMARRYWPGENPIGKRLRIGRFMSWSPYHEIIGVVKDTRYNRTEPAPAPHLYLPLSQNFNSDVIVLARSTKNPRGLQEALRRVTSALDSSLPPPLVRTLAEELAERDSLQRMIAALVSLFGFIALTLASIGSYAVISYSVAQQTREIGIRMAIGAKPWEVLKLVLGRALQIALAGVALGVIVALSLGRIIASQLYGISPFNPSILVGASALLIASAMLASYVPAHRALRIDPSTALRHE